MADRRRSDVEWRGRGQDPGRGNRRDVTEHGRDMERVRGYSGEDRGPGRGRDEGRRGGLMRGAPGAQRPPPYDTDRWDRGYGTRGFGDDDYRPPRVQSSFIEQRPRTGYSTSPTRDMDRDMGHGAGRGGMQGAYPYDEQSPELPRRQGRGPRGYQRSDERIREDICDRLMQSWMDADDVTVRVEKGEVTLSGTVKSRDEKRAIEDLAEEVLGVKDVSNELRVAREQQREEDSRRDTGDQQGRTLHS